MKTLQSLLLAGFIFLLPLTLNAEETNVLVRVLAHDAKFIGSGMGGVQAVLENAATGEMLDSGLITGSTGDTEVIMKTPRDRNAALSRGGAAQWVGKVDIEAPTRVKLKIAGPMAAGANLQEASKTFWVLPGQDIGGDGILLELHGFAVQPVFPGLHQKFRPGDEVPVEAHVVMMCGCPVGPNELWDSRNYAIRAQVRKGEEVVAEFPLRFTGAVSRFGGSYQPEETGTYEITITAADPQHNNFGVGLITFVVK